MTYTSNLNNSGGCQIKYEQFKEKKRVSINGLALFHNPATKNIFNYK